MEATKKATPINLGRMVNKYLIIEVFVFAAEEAKREHTESLLWTSSLKHRAFLFPNRDWYLRKIDKCLDLRLMRDSRVIRSPEQAFFAARQLPPASALWLIYSGSLYGWHKDAFHDCCDRRKWTLTLVRSTEGFECGAFSSVPWGDGTERNKLFADPHACLFTLTGEKKRLRLNEPFVFRSLNYGPHFGS